MPDRLITIAIHTHDRALQLKNLLQREGIDAILQNVNLETPVVSSGMRVRIKEKDLPAALRVIESREIFEPEAQSSASPKIVLVPIDFSDYSKNACNIAFHFAKSFNAEILILHTYIDPLRPSALQLSDTLDYEVSDINARESIEHNEKELMDGFCAQIRSSIKSGRIPAVKFSSKIIEGVPEEIINQYSKDLKPMLIVMGTRGADTKERDLVGSVTAEVLDVCRYNIFTVPDNIEFASLSDIHNVVFFNNFEQDDILALDQLAHMLPNNPLSIRLVGIPNRKHPGANTIAEQKLLEYCRSHYPNYTFEIDRLSIKSYENDFDRISYEKKIDLIAVPNKKRNAVVRFFNPGIAHRLLFHSDIPMMVIPV